MYLLCTCYSNSVIPVEILYQTHLPSNNQSRYYIWKETIIPDKYLDFKSDQCINFIPYWETITMVFKVFYNSSFATQTSFLTKSERSVKWAGVEICVRVWCIIGQRKVSLTGSCHHYFPLESFPLSMNDLICFVIQPHSQVQLQSTKPSEVIFSSKLLICLLYAWNCFKCLGTLITFGDRFNDCLRFTYEETQSTDGSVICAGMWN